MDISNWQASVGRMVARYGGSITVEKGGEGVYDTATSEYVGGATTHTVRALVFDYTLQSNGAATAKGSLLEVGDKQVLIEPTTAVQNLNPAKDSIFLGDKKYRIVTYKETNPSLSGNILIECYVRLLGTS